MTIPEPNEWIALLLRMVTTCASPLKHLLLTGQVREHLCYTTRVQDPTSSGTLGLGLDGVAYWEGHRVCKGAVDVFM